MNIITIDRIEQFVLESPMYVKYFHVRMTQEAVDILNEAGYKWYDSEEEIIYCHRLFGSLSICCHTKLVIPSTSSITDPYLCYGQCKICNGDMRYLKTIDDVISYCPKCQR